MKKVIITNETLQEVISRITTMATNDNKVRVTIGQKDTGNGLACWAAVVNGGAMLKTAFRTVAPKKPVELEEGKPYFEFICKAKDLVTNAGALLTFKSDVTLADDEGKVFFSVGGSKVPVGKVSAETAEPLLQEDYDQRFLVFQGDKAVATLEKGGFSSTMEQGTAVTAKIEGGQLIASSVAKTNYCLYGCPVVTQGVKKEQAKGANGQESNVSEEVVKDAKIYLARYYKDLPEEEQAELSGKIASVTQDAKALTELASKFGWKAPEMETNEIASPEAQPPVEEEAPVYFTLSSANWKLLTKLFAGSTKAVFMVTPKNLHVTDTERHVRATFALNDAAVKFYEAVERAHNIPRDFKAVVDRDALNVALGMMKLGNPQLSFNVTADAKGLHFKKEGEEITSSIPIIKSEGNLAAVKHNYNASLLGTFLATLKAGNVLLELSTVNDKIPVIMSNGDLENGGSGWSGVSGVDVAKARAEAEKKAKADAAKADTKPDGDGAEESAEE